MQLGVGGEHALGSAVRSFQDSTARRIAVAVGALEGELGDGGQGRTVQLLCHLGLGFHYQEKHGDLRFTFIVFLKCCVD